MWGYPHHSTGDSADGRAAWGESENRWPIPTASAPFLPPKRRQDQGSSSGSESQGSLLLRRKRRGSGESTMLLTGEPRPRRKRFSPRMSIKSSLAQTQEIRAAEAEGEDRAGGF